MLSIFSHYSPPNMLRRVGRGDGKETERGRGTVEVCFVRRLLWYYIFFSQKSMDWNLPPLPRGSNIYLNVLSINITRLVL